MVGMVTAERIALLIEDAPALALIGLAAPGKLTSRGVSSM